MSSSAVKDYETAAKHSEGDRHIKEGLERAQRLLKQSQKRDYYKILGVKRWEPVNGFGNFCRSSSARKCNTLLPTVGGEFNLEK